MKIPCRIVKGSSDGTERSDGTESSEDAVMELCWGGELMGLPASIMLGDEVRRITPKGRQECLFEVWETQRGLLAWVVKRMMCGKLVRMSEGVASGLRGFVEGGKVREYEVQ